VKEIHDDVDPLCGECMLAPQCKIDTKKLNSGAPATSSNTVEQESKTPSSEHDNPVNGLDYFLNCLKGQFEYKEMAKGDAVCYLFSEDGKDRVRVVRNKKSGRMRIETSGWGSSDKEKIFDGMESVEQAENLIKELKS